MFANIVANFFSFEKDDSVAFPAHYEYKLRECNCYESLFWDSLIKIKRSNQLKKISNFFQLPRHFWKCLIPIKPWGDVYKTFFMTLK